MRNVISQQDGIKAAISAFLDRYSRAARDFARKRQLQSEHRRDCGVR